MLRADPDTLHRKKKRQEERQKKLSTTPSIKYVKTSSAIPSDELLLIQHARERLRSNPDEAQRWYNRARFALVEEETSMRLEANIPHREDVLAVWEYLERSIDLQLIISAFEVKN